MRPTHPDTPPPPPVPPPDAGAVELRPSDPLLEQPLLQVGDPEVEGRPGASNLHRAMGVETDSLPAPLSPSGLPRLFTPRPMPRAVKIGAGILLLLLVGFAIGRAIFLPPRAPSFDHLEDSDQPPPETVELAPAANPEEVAAPPTLEGLWGTWIIDFGQRGQVQVRLTREQQLQGSYRGSAFPLYAAEGGGLPSHFGLPPSPGDTLVWQDGKGQPREVFEQVEIHNADLFSFTEPATGRRRYAHRAGSLGAPGLGEGEPGGAGGADPSLIDGLWRQAEAQRAAGQHADLARTLAHLRALDPADSRVAEWQEEAERSQAQSRRAAFDEIRDKLHDLENAIEDRDLRDLRRLWGGQLDAETSRYFTQLFRNTTHLKVESRLLSVVLDGRGPESFDAVLRISTRTRGNRKWQVDEQAWQSDYRDGHFASPFR
jgi:hypothetical protein